MRNYLPIRKIVAVAAGAGLMWVARRYGLDLGEEAANEAALVIVALAFGYLENDPRVKSAIKVGSIPSTGVHSIYYRPTQSWPATYPDGATTRNEAKDAGENQGEKDEAEPLVDGPTAFGEWSDDVNEWLKDLDGRIRALECETEGHDTDEPGGLAELLDAQIDARIREAQA